MSLGLYLNFETETKEVIKYYEKIFDVTCSDITHYKDMPADPKFQIPEESLDLVLNASLLIHETKVMFADVGGMGMEHIVGNNITLVLEIADENVLVNQFHALSQEGNIVMPLEKTFWAEKYGYLVDKFGIGWQFNLSK